MPNVWCHIMLAQEFTKSLPEDIGKRLCQGDAACLYRLAAQGPDFFMYDNWQHCYIGSRYQVGRFLHRADCRNALVFSISEIDQKNAAALSPLTVYTLGAVAHFVVDANIHPLVYAILAEQNGGTNLHSRLEAEMDRFLMEEIYQRFWPLLTDALPMVCGEAEQQAVFEYYLRLCNDFFKNSLPPLSAEEIKRALRSYWRAQSATHQYGNAYKICRGLSELSGRRLALDNLWRPQKLEDSRRRLFYQKDFPTYYDQAIENGRAVFDMIWRYWQGQATLSEVKALLPAKNYLGGPEVS
jgi:hypothetical protein